MREFVFKGMVKFRGAEFYILAENLEEAVAKAAAGDFVEYLTDAAETVNWKIDPDSGEESV